jgi:outer membrane protein assembly factor BamB
MTTLLRAALLLALLLPSAGAEAVIPSAFGPIQALIVILPQLLLALAAAMLALFKPRTYRLLGAYLASHKLFTAVLLAGIGWLLFGPSPGGGAAAAERAGAAWPLFRGGPARTGAVAGARGPRSAPRVLWRLAGDALGPTSAVDSSPALVGNRLYFGLSNQSAFGSSGGIYAVDTDTGGVAWAWTGKGELTPPLRPVFSSPAVAELAEPARRYVVSGEGYHEDRDCRILALDLEPVARKEPPRLAWAVQTTSHVESAPCVDAGRVVIGCGDDGVWCVDLATGKVLWRIEGGPYYDVKEGPQANALAALEGRSVVASGTAVREGLGAKGKDDAGVLVLDVKTFREHSGLPVTASEPNSGFERTITGKVVKPAQGRLRIEAAFFNPDSESPPAAAAIDGRRVFLFGSGLEGRRVNCVDAATGALIWKSPTPHPAFGAPTVDGDRVLVGVGNGNFLASDPKPAGAVLCFSLKDGKELWKVAVGDNVIGAVAVAGGKAYACSRDGHVHVLDAAKGAVLAKWPVGAPMVSSPAVTADAVTVATDAGKLFSFDRASGELLWSFPLSPGSPIFCSPGVGGGSVFVGTRSKGVFALAERPADGTVVEVARPWEGPGGDAGRSGGADERGLPAVAGEESVAKWPQAELLKRPVTGPLAACGKHVYVPFEKSFVQVDAETGQPRWEAPFPVSEILARPDGVWVRDAKGAWAALDPSSGKPLSGKEPPPPPLQGTVGAPIRAHELEVAALSTGILICRSAWRPVTLWTTKLETTPLAAPALAGDRVLVAAAGAGKAKGFLLCFRLTDGSPVWKQELDEAPIGHPVAAADWVAVPTADDKIACFRVSDGKLREPLMVGGRPVPPALVDGVLVIAGENRLAAHDLAAGEWPWNYKDQDNLGKVSGQPVVCRETIWVGTEKRGLVAVGVPPEAPKK